tara:strand:- start:10777 stop:11052 length:276 start_codon:yes stop_codon:yes gene_type:complete
MGKLGYNQSKHPFSMKGVTDNAKFSANPLEGNAFGGKMAENMAKGMTKKEAAQKAANDLKDMPIDDRAGSPAKNLNKGYGSKMGKPANAKK